MNFFCFSLDSIPIFHFCFRFLISQIWFWEICPSNLFADLNVMIVVSRDLIGLKILIVQCITTLFRSSAVSRITACCNQEVDTKFFEKGLKNICKWELLERKVNELIGCFSRKINGKGAGILWNMSKGHTVWQSWLEEYFSWALVHIKYPLQALWLKREGNASLYKE